MAPRSKDFPSLTHPDLAPIFDAAMPAIHGHETTAMLEAYDFSAIQLLADIGGGNGSLIGAVLQRYPKLKGLLFESYRLFVADPASVKFKAIKRLADGNSFARLVYARLSRSWSAGE